MVSRRNFITFKNSNNKELQERDILIYIFQRGAADGLNLVVPYGDSSYYDHRPTLALPAPDSGEGSVLDLDGYFGLNPNMAALLPIYNNGDLAIVHACGSLESTHSHFETQAFVDRGSSNTDISSGWLARFENNRESSNESVFQTIAMNTSIPKSLAEAENVIAIDSIDSFKIETPESEMQSISAQLKNLYSGEDNLDKVSQATFSAVETIEDINIEDYPIDNGAEYPQSQFASRLQNLAVLIKAGIGIESASVDIGGWDTHDSQDRILSGLAQDYSDSIAAFYMDLGEYMDNITIITVTEFGRRVYENASGGTDHGTGNVAFVIGGGVNGGLVYTDWPGLQEEALVGPGDLAVTTDYRTIIAELLEKRMNYTETQQVFPDFQIPDYLGIFTNKI